MSVKMLMNSRKMTVNGLILFNLNVFRGLVKAQKCILVKPSELVIYYLLMIGDTLIIVVQLEPPK